jgi:hypothetical protein
MMKQTVKQHHDLGVHRLGRNGCAFLLSALAMLFSTWGTVAAQGADWGSLKGRLVYAGDAGTPKAINVTKDEEFCGKHTLVDEQLVVAADGGLANVFVYLYLKRGKSVDVHPDYDKLAGKPVVLDNKGCRFEPHAITVYTKQPLEIRNSDEGIGHNTNAQALMRNPKFNDLISSDSPLIKNFKKSEAYPSPFACNVHPWMGAQVLIRENPYMAISGKDGSFEIKNIPAGKHEFLFWHEASGNMRELAVGGDQTSRRGRVMLTVPAGETLDLGEVKVAPSVLGK